MTPQPSYRSGVTHIGSMHSARRWERVAEKKRGSVRWRQRERDGGDEWGERGCDQTSSTAASGVPAMLTRFIHLVLLKQRQSEGKGAVWAQTQQLLFFLTAYEQKNSLWNEIGAGSRIWNPPGKVRDSEGKPKQTTSSRNTRRIFFPKPMTFCNIEMSDLKNKHKQRCSYFPLCQSHSIDSVTLGKLHKSTPMLWEMYPYTSSRWEKKKR